MWKISAFYCYGMKVLYQMSISYSISIYYIEYTFAIAYTKLPIGYTAWEFCYESRAICPSVHLSICPSVHPSVFLENRGSSGLQTWICYEAGCIDGKITQRPREVGETAGSRGECALIEMRCEVDGGW